MIKVGDSIPADIALQYMEGKKLKRVKTSELFAKGRSLLVAIPAPFSPACSELHLAGYVAKSYELKKKGIDTIFFISTSDAFVMDAWAKDNNIVNEVRMLADGNAEFTHAIGMDIDMSKFSLGERTTRYAMLVEDGVVKMLNLEKGGALDVSTVEKVLEKL